MEKAITQCCLKSVPCARTSSKCAAVALGDETFVKDFQKRLQKSNDTLQLWNFSVANKNDNPTLLVLLTFPPNFHVHQNIIACKPNTYRLPFLNCAITQCQFCGAFRQIKSENINTIAHNGYEYEISTNSSCRSKGYKCLKKKEKKKTHKHVNSTLPNK